MPVKLDYARKGATEPRPSLIRRALPGVAIGTATGAAWVLAGRAVVGYWLAWAVAILLSALYALYREGSLKSSVFPVTLAASLIALAGIPWFSLLLVLLQFIIHPL